MSAPQFWIVAGPNGSGKSTIIRSGLLDRWTGSHLDALSPDDIVLQLRQTQPTLAEADLLRQAQQRSDLLVDQAIAEGRTVMVETVLSSMKFQMPVARALKAGFEFGFVYVIVRSAELNIGRVADRVEAGGHDVPEDRIMARRERSVNVVPWFAATATMGLIVDNTTTPLVLAEKPRDESVWSIIEPDRLKALGIQLPP